MRLAEADDEEAEEHAATGALPRQKRMSRPRRWADAVSRADAALQDLRDLQEEYQGWHGSLPENLAESPTAQKLDEIDGLDLESAIAIVNEAEMIDLPRGFGRD